MDNNLDDIIIEWLAAGAEEVFILPLLIIYFLLLVIIRSMFGPAVYWVCCGCGLYLTNTLVWSVFYNQVERQARTNRGALLAISSILIAWIIYFVFLELDVMSSNIPCIIIGLVNKVPTLDDLIWFFVFNDVILKFIADLTMIGVFLMPSNMIIYQKRRVYCYVLNVTFLLYRLLAPLQQWLMYLLYSKGDGTDSIPIKVLKIVFLAGAYIQTYMVLSRDLSLSSFKVACVKLMQSSRYGKTPSEDQIKVSGGNCSICQDTYHDPAMLHCKHIFCGDCVAKWLEKNTTCPMCRAKVY